MFNFRLSHVLVMLLLILAGSLNAYAHTFGPEGNPPARGEVYALYSCEEFKIDFQKKPDKMKLELLSRILLEFNFLARKRAFQIYRSAIAGEVDDALDKTLVVYGQFVRLINNMFRFMRSQDLVGQARQLCDENANAAVNDLAVDYFKKRVQIPVEGITRPKWYLKQK